VNVKEYQNQILKLCTDTPFISDFNLTFEEIDEHTCYISGVLDLIDSSSLYVSEYIEVQIQAKCLKYRFHWQNKDKSLIARWDNVPHYKDISTSPYHLHEGEKILPSQEMNFSLIIKEIGNRLI